MQPLFNVRVYGILIEKGTILVSDEIHHQKKITKFPGGGLQFGEGTHECLVREFMEELNIQIKVKDHFYTVDFFQPSAFDASQQVISIYYMVTSEQSMEIPTAMEKLKFKTEENGAQQFRWVAIENMTPEEFTFPIDQKVSKLLKAAIGVQ